MSTSSPSSILLRKGLAGAALAAFAFALFVVIRSIIHFTSTGPTIRDEVAEHFFGYSVFAVTRLGLWAFIISLVLATAGLLVYAALVAHRRSPGWFEGFVAGGAGIGIGFAYQFAYVLVHEPSTILASWAYAPHRLVAVWPYVHYPELFPLVKALLFLAVTIAVLRITGLQLRRQQWRASLGLLVPFAGVMTLIAWVHWEPEPRISGALAAQTEQRSERPNIVVIGNDTMRADRIGIVGEYHRHLTPFIDSLARRGTYFSEAYVPQARTAPAMTTILTGAWTDTHTITSNFARDAQTALGLPTLPKLLQEHGYQTKAIGDWASSDVGKFEFGFKELMVSPDQWNFKYLLRQGPRDLRLFVSLFTGNKFGRLFVPELYYIAGRPLTTDKAREARRALSRLAAEEDPFLLMLFVATSHGPFGSEYPYYTLFSGPGYSGDAKFAMTRVSTPEEIEVRQAQGREAFDVQQLLDLYDATIVHFDDEVRSIVTHLERLGIADNTIVVVFSDHGTDFFERGSWGQGNIVGARDYSGQIPLLFVDPRRAGAGVVPRLVRAVDIAPTLADLAGIDAYGLFEGASLVPYIDGTVSDLRLAAYTETGELISRVRGLRDDQLRAPNLLQLLEIPDKRTGTISISAEGMHAIESARQRLIRTERWAAVRLPLTDGAEYFLYDLHDASQNPTDLSDTHPDVMECFTDAFAAEGALHQRLGRLSTCLDGFY